MNEFASAAAATQQMSPLTDRIRSVINAKLSPEKLNSKDAIRAEHANARIARIRESAEWIQNAWRKRSHYFANGNELDPESITPKLVQVSNTEQQDLFRLARYTWSLPYSRGYGRRLRFLVMDTHHNKLIGVLGLQSAPIDFTPRDRFIAYPKDQKVALVNQTMDIFTLGAVPPYNRLLAGKLMIYAAASREIPEAYRKKYSEAVTEIQGVTIPANLVMLTTTSAFGRSSIYNRVYYREGNCQHKREIATKLGCTKGYNSLHFDEIYQEIKEFLIKQGIPANQGFGRGPRPVWQNITKALTMLNIGGNGLKHGISREAWGIPLARNAWDYLCGNATEPDYYDTPFQDLADWWMQRWLLPRSIRVNDWRQWTREQTLRSITGDTPDE